MAPLENETDQSGRR